MSGRLITTCHFHQLNEPKTHNYMMDTNCFFSMHYKLPFLKERVKETGRPTSTLIAWVKIFWNAPSKKSNLEPLVAKQAPIHTSCIIVDWKDREHAVWVVFVWFLNFGFCWLFKVIVGLTGIQHSLDHPLLFFGNVMTHWILKLWQPIGRPNSAFEFTGSPFFFLGSDN